MAKSLRAKSQLKAKSVKRKNEFQKAADARSQRLAEKLRDDLVRQKVEELKKQNNGAEIDETTLEALENGSKPAPDAMEEDSKKVSTSGWRDARHHTYKKNKKLAKSRKKGSFTKF
ncbi:LAMI_0E09010g1_1 [Lachancea mirantina]|uniref:LAMI_0E09010g1_1 n=1 Tax=Lachancea mirantina TaxID=1230905 RepID=A0A1G4JN95_9SACH|nr:LAMI_0E09010g1_1 [Lachancea mirantina]